jgi:putative ABC transport system substrate-binding protein
MGASVAWPFAAMAQEPGRTYRLGCLLLAPRDAPIVVAFFDELRRHGFTEGQNLTVEYRVQHLDLISQHAAELVAARVDVIATAGDETARAVQQATKTIPIVAIVGDMLGSGLVTSLARPEGNTTGVSILVDEADGKRQDILIEAVPGLRLMAVLVDANVNYTKNPAKLTALQEAARAHKAEFSIHRVARAEEIAAAIDSAQASGATALNILSSALFYAHRHLIMEHAAAAHLPTIYELPETAEEGGFAAYGPRNSQLFAEILPRQIVKVLRGTKVADIPVEQPTKFEHQTSYEVSPPHSITSSARANNASGTVTPIALAVLRLITSRRILPRLLPPVDGQVEQPIAVIHSLDAAPRRPVSLEDIRSSSQVANDMHHAHPASDQEGVERVRGGRVPGHLPAHEVAVPGALFIRALAKRGVCDVA